MLNITCIFYIGCNPSLNNFNFEDWIIGLSTLVILIFGYGLGFYFFYQSRKMKTLLLSLLSLSMISVSFAWLPVVLDFFLVLFDNIRFNLLVYIYLTWVQLPFTVLLSQYVAAELLVPSKKVYVMYFLEFMGILFLVFLFLDPVNSINPMWYPSGNFYYKFSLNINSITGIIGIILIIFVLTFSGIGYLYKSSISNKTIRKNFGFLGLGMIFVSLFGLLNSIVNGIFLVFVRIGAICGLFLTYWGLKPRVRKKQVLIEDDMKLISYFLHKPKSNDIIGEIEYYRKLLKRPISLFMSFYEGDLKLFKIREIVLKLKDFPEINNKIYWTYEMERDIFKFSQEMIDKFDIMLLFCSKDALNSTEIKNQWISAYENGKIIIPICMKSDFIPESLKSHEILFYDLYDFNKNMLYLRYLMLKSIFLK